MQLQHLSHSAIDKGRWLNTILGSPNGLVYAWPQYLDAVSPGWQALVSEDYRFVMPLTANKKWGIRYLYQPPFTQQLGVFGKWEITEAITQPFVTAAQKHIRFAEIALNYHNSFAADFLFPRKNYVLDLTADYTTIRAGYSNDLFKKNLPRTQKFGLQFSITGNIAGAVKTYQELYAARTPHVVDQHYDRFAALCLELYKTGNAFVAEVKMPSGELLACGLFLKDDRRLYNVASSTLPNGRTLEANHFLFDQLIQQYAGSGLLLDFEGSDIEGIERFYKKFGAVNQPYFFTRWNHLPWPLRLLKK